MPFVNIKFVRDNIAADPEGKKAAIAKRVSEAVSSEMGVDQSAVWVVFEDIGSDDWYLGAESVREHRMKK